MGRGLFGAMRIQPIPQQKPRRLQFLIEGLQKGNGPRGIDLLPGIQAKIQLHLVTLRRDTQSSNGRDLLVVATPLMEHRGLAAGSPSYGAPAGLTENRFRPETPATPSAGALFFNRGPNLLDPLPNSVFVPLDGFACRFLRAPVHGVQQSTNVIHVIAHTEAALDVLGDPRTGPQIGAESRRLRTSQQLLLQLLALLRRQFRRSSAGWNGSESSFASAALGTLPTADAARVNLEDAGDFSLRQALLEQIDGALTFALQLFRTALRSDRSPPHHQSSIGHYLCRNQ